jgi:hypothetical protein
MTEPVFVSKDWVEKVDAELKNDAPPQPVATPPSSRFYDVRPISIQSGWSQNDAGVWSANAAFIVNDSVDTSFIFPVYAPLSLGETPGGFTSTKMFAIWRGRWEVLPQKRPTLDTTTAQVVASFPAFGTDRFLLDSGIVNNITNVTLTSYDRANDVPSDGTPYIPYVARMEQLGTTWQPVVKYLHLAVQKQPFSSATALIGLAGAIDYTNVIESVSIR